MRLSCGKSERYPHMWSIRDLNPRTKGGEPAVVAYALSEKLAETIASALNHMLES